MPPTPSRLTMIEPADARDLAGVGFLVGSGQRSGTYVLQDAHTHPVQVAVDGLELLPLAEALRRYDWVRERYYWQLIDRQMDQVTAELAAEPEPLGYFVRVHHGDKVAFPCQSGLLITQPGSTQKVHNVVILEPDSELHLVTGCLTHCGVDAGLHLAASEMWVGAGARLTNTMVHSWGPEVEVRPRGLDEQEAVSLIIRGFLVADIEGLGTELDARIAELARLATEGAS